MPEVKKKPTPKKPVQKKEPDMTTVLTTQIESLQKQLKEAQDRLKPKKPPRTSMPIAEDDLLINRPKLMTHYLAAKDKRLKDPDMKKKLTINGYAETTRMMSPLDNADYEHWGLNELYLLIPMQNVTRWFEIHAPSGNLHNSRRNPRHRKWLQEAKIPIYMPKKIEDIPMSIPYPIEEIKSIFGDYFTNSISYMIALGLYEGFSHIEVYGVDMALNKEYREQKPSCEWFMGMAAILCDTFVIPFESDMLKAHYLYGFENSQPMERKYRDKIEELRAKKNNAYGDLEEIKAGINKLDGAIEVTTYFLNNHINPEE